MARQTLEAYKSTLTDHDFTVPRGTRFYEIPSAVLREGDRRGVHLKSNIVDIVRLVKGAKPGSLKEGKTTQDLSFVFNRAGKLSLRAPDRRLPPASGV